MGMKWGRSALAWGGAITLVVLLFILMSVTERWQVAFHTPVSKQALPFGVLGDSDSHSYHDDVNFGDAPEVRGGAWRSRTWQWTEILGHLRADALDPGPWGTWGTRFRRLAVARQSLGQNGRFPTKEDYLYNLAFSGAVCAHLNDAPRDQVGRLLKTMDTEPERWRQGVVVVRIGTNDFGGQSSLDALSRDPTASEAVDLIDRCLLHIQQAVGRLHGAYPDLRIVLVGIFNNSEWEKFAHLWPAPEKLANIHLGLARFDNGLRAMTNDHKNLLVFDDQAWFASLWGTRRVTGLPTYRKVKFGSHFEVSNTGGDAPSNATLADGHAGTVWNALWAQALVELLRGGFGIPLKPLGTEELIEFVDHDGQLGMR